MRLITLGGLRLEGSTFTETQPLFLLAYLALNGQCLRGNVQDLFWPHQTNKTKRIKSLSTALGRLKKERLHLVEPGRATLTSYVVTDAQAFEQAVKDKRYEAAARLYGGTFLRGLERTRLKLGEELDAWVVAKRAELQASFVRVLLALADDHASRAEPALARTYIQQALTLPEEVGVLPVQALVRIRDLLSRLGYAHEAEQVAEKARDYYGHPLSLNENMPVSVTTSSLVGREADLADLARRYAQGQRLVSVTGLAGIGKTALARAFMGQAFPYFDEAYFVPLASLASNATPEDLWHALAEALGFGANVHGLKGYLHTRTLLLVLDNFEPFLALRSVISELYRDCPGLGFLVTSREPLGLEGEHVLRLTGLDTPGEAASLTDLARFDSGRLLLAEGQRHGLSFRDEDGSVLAELCRQTAGVPLALKLAAGWLPSLPLGELVRQLSQSSGLLSSGELAMNAAFDLSIDLLEPEARALFFQLGVFKDGFSFRAAQAILDARPHTLKRLVDASLLEFQGRYTLHPLIDRHLAEHFSPTEELRARHAQHFLSTLQALIGSDPAQKDRALETLKGDLANLAAAWDWLTQQGDTETLKTHLPALQRLCDVLARARLGLELTERSLRSLAHTALAPHLQASRAWFLLRLGRYDEAITAANQTLPTLSKSCPAKETCINALGAAHDSLGQFAEAKRAFEQSLHLAEAHSGEAATALGNLAINAIHQGAYEDAHEYLGKATAIFNAQTKRAKLVWCSYVAGWLALETGDLLRAQIKLEQALAEAQALELRHWELLSDIKRAGLYGFKGNTEYAQQQCRRILKDVRGSKLINKEIRTLSTLGAILVKEPASALGYYSASLQVSRGTRSEPIMLRNLVGILNALRQLEFSTFDAPLYTFCSGKLPHMVYWDRQAFSRLAPAPDDAAWLSLSTEEVAALTLSLLKEAGVHQHPQGA